VGPCSSTATCGRATPCRPATTLWGMVDWDAAGAGRPGVDLGTLRCDAAIRFGLPAAGEILVGWRQVTGWRAAALAYWDLVAALTTPTDMRMARPDQRSSAVVGGAAASGCRRPPC
jgi:aminoglycoside phosphotransferase (APT) family kinase protein